MEVNLAQRRLSKRPRLCIDVNAVDCEQPCVQSCDTAMANNGPASSASVRTTQTSQLSPAESGEINNASDAAQKLYMLVLQSHQVSIPLKVCAHTQRIWQELEKNPPVVRDELSTPQGSWCCSSDGASISQNSSTAMGPSLAQRRPFSKTISVSVAPFPADNGSAAPIFPQAPTSTTNSCENLKSKHGWFAKCRGCALLTGQVYTVSSEGSTHIEVPICRGCSKQITTASQQQKQGMEEQLMFIHSSWQRSGL